MAQNIYDSEAFFSGYARLPRSMHGLAGAPEWPSIQAQLPQMAGARVVDLGCGYGWFARWARAQGAAHVLGIDISERMLARAAEQPDPGIAYRRADLEQLDLPPEAFDLAYSSLAFHYVADFARLMRVVQQALRPGGRLVFTIEHPIFMASRDPGWAGRSWRVDHYAEEGLRVTDWLAKGVEKYHRTLSTTLNTLIGCGFAIRHVEEWAPTPGQLAAQPALNDEVQRPMMLLVSATRP
jgi:SAM-dependent methyltransferase